MQYRYMMSKPNIQVLLKEGIKVNKIVKVQNVKQFCCYPDRSGCKNEQHFAQCNNFIRWIRLHTIFRPPKIIR